MAKLRLKEILKRKKITHREFAKMVKMDRGSLARYLRKNSNPTINTLQKFAKVLRLRVRDLLVE